MPNFPRCVRPCLLEYINPSASPSSWLRKCDLQDSKPTNSTQVVTSLALQETLKSHLPHPRLGPTHLKYIFTLHNIYQHNACPPSISTASLPRPSTKPSSSSTSKVEALVCCQYTNVPLRGCRILCNSFAALNPDGTTLFPTTGHSDISR